MNKILKPNSILIEKVAGELAATWFEAAGNTPGFNMHHKKYKNDPRRFARANLEKFIPQAIEILLGMLNRPDIALEMKEEIYDCLIDRVNDPRNVTSADMTGIPDIDAKKLTELLATPADKIIDQSLEKKRDKPIEIKSDTAVGNVVYSSNNELIKKPIENPFRAKRH
jgi:hypothetical protein